MVTKKKKKKINVRNEKSSQANSSHSFCCSFTLWWKLVLLWYVKRMKWNFTWENEHLSLWLGDLNSASLPLSWWNEKKSWKLLVNRRECSLCECVIIYKRRNLFTSRALRIKTTYPTIGVFYFFRVFELTKPSWRYEKRNDCDSIRFIAFEKIYNGRSSEIEFGSNECSMISQANASYYTWNSDD